MKVRAAQLLLVICVLWLVAGLNVLIIGIGEMLGHHDWWVFLGALAVFVVFATFIFPPVIKRYTKRVAEMGNELRRIGEALDAKGYLTVLVMMGVGIALRVSGIASDWFIALFYSGLGTALILAALGFLHNHFALTWRMAHPAVEHAHSHQGHARCHRPSSPTSS
jgi:hypothetical protein